MNFFILKQVIKDAWRAIKLGYLSSRRDNYGFIHPTAEVLQPCNCNKSNIYLYEYSKIGENSTISNHSGKFIMKKNARAGARLNVICQNHDFFRVGTYPGDMTWRTGMFSSGRCCLCKK